MAGIYTTESAWERLSPMFPSPVEIVIHGRGRHVAPNVLSAYRIKCVVGPATQLRILNATSWLHEYASAKKRTDLNNERRVGILYRLYKEAANPQFLEALSKTGNQIIYASCLRYDYLLGFNPSVLVNQGENLVGQALMKLRKNHT